MKPFTLASFVLLSAIAITQKAYAKEVNVRNHETSSGRAAALVTHPVTINSGTANVVEQNNRLKQITNSIPTIHSQPSQSFNPLDVFKNPSATVKQFFQENPNQTPQPVDPLGVSKAPPLDSNTTGINVTVTHF